LRLGIRHSGVDVPDIDHLGRDLIPINAILMLLPFVAINFFLWR
jgi:hypothetical protein